MINSSKRGEGSLSASESFPRARGDNPSSVALWSAIALQSGPPSPTRGEGKRGAEAPARSPRGLHARVLDHLGPFRRFGGDVIAELLRRIADRSQALFGE